MSKIGKKMGNPVPGEMIVEPTQNSDMENYGNLQPIAWNMKHILWVLGRNLSFGLLPNVHNAVDVSSKHFFLKTTSNMTSYDNHNLARR